jgi:hypothetical protein
MATRFCFNKFQYSAPSQFFTSILFYWFHPKW